MKATEPKYKSFIARYDEIILSTPRLAREFTMKLAFSTTWEKESTPKNGDCMSKFFP